MMKHLLTLLMATTVVFCLNAQSIKGIVWRDDNADGIKQAAELGINSISVSLVDVASNTVVAGPVNTSTILGIPGSYAFNGLAAGEYKVRFNDPFPAPSNFVSPKDQGTDDSDSDASVTAPHETDGYTITAANEDFEDVYMGLYSAGTINGQVWEDQNGNGQRGGGDGACPQNVNVTLISVATGTPLATDAAGNALTNPVNTNSTYSFLNITPGDYIVTFQEPGGVYNTGLHLTLQDVNPDVTDSDADRVSGETATLNLSAGQTINNIDAGYFLVGQVGDFVWEDLNGNGSQDGGEPGLGGIEVNLELAAGGPALDADGNAIPQAITGGGGDYLFDAIPPGSYRVRFQLNPVAGSGNTLYFTKKDIGGEAIDSDANRTTGIADPVIVIESGTTENIDIDAGYYQKCRIGDVTWHDLNGDGLQAGEPGIEANIVITDVATGGNVAFEVDGTTPYTAAISSAAAIPSYLYDDLPPGEYKLTFTAPAGFYLTTQTAGTADGSDPDKLTGMTANFTCESGEIVDDIDAGFYTKCTIGDFVWHDLDGDGIQGGEPGLGGIQIVITDNVTGAAPAIRADGTPYNLSTISSSGGGAYIFDNLPPGNYKLTFSDPSALYKLTLYEAGGDNTRDNDADITMGGMTRSFTCNSQDVIENIDAGFFTRAIVRGVAWHDSDGDGIFDAGEPPLENVTFTLINTAGGPTLDFDGAALGPQISDASGNYTFSNIRPGTYTMTANLAGWLFTIPLVGGTNDSEFDAGGNLINDVVVPSGQTVSNINAGLYKLITVGGTIWGEGDNNSMFGAPPDNQTIQNVTVDLCKDGASIQSTTSNAMGVYQFTGVVPGNYVIKVTADNFSSAQPLEGLESCDGQGGDDDVDDDDNGDGNGPTTTASIALYCGLEPGADGVVNETIDFCYKANCGTPNALASAECIEADTICDLPILEVFCSRMPTENGSLFGQALCPSGGIFHNTSWFAFVAGGGTYDLVFNIFACQGNGAQAGIFTDCTLSDPIICEANCFTGPFTVSSSILTPGNVYWFFLDGCNGSICSYNVDIQGDFQQYQIPDIVDISCTSTFGRCDTICPNNTITFQAEDQYENTKGQFIWEITDPMNIKTTLVTENKNMDFLFTKIGVYKVKLVAINVKCSLPIAPYEIEVVVANPADEDWGKWPVCEIDLSLGWIPPYQFGTASTDPNGDGDAGWIGGDLFAAGIYNRNVTTASGCRHMQSVEVIKLLNSKRINIDTFLCPATSLQIGNITLKNEVFPRDIYTIPNAVGCDSIINLGLAFFGIDGYLDKNPCLNGITTLEFFLNSIANNPMAAQYPFGYKYTWYDSNSNEINDGDPDNNPRTIIVNKNGNYKLVIEQTANNSKCEFEFFYTLDLGNAAPFPPTVQGTWPVSLCKDNAIASYSVTTNQDPSIVKGYIWTVPAGAVIVGKADTSTIVVDWTNAVNGKICAAIKGECAISPTVCDSVTIHIIPTATLAAIAPLCTNTNAIVNANITSLPGFVYNWDFDGGNVVSGNVNSAGPITVSWGVEGSKTINLVVDNNGCKSAPATTNVTVIKPELPPVINCQGSLGQVEFTWDAVPGASTTANYTVTVGAGQKTGNLTGNAATGFSYLVTGLGLLEKVDITVTVNTNSPCGLITSTGSCEAQNCTPPEVEITEVAAICLTNSTATIPLQVIITPANQGGGNFVWSGKGVNALGVFDPKLADLGQNTIVLDYTSPDGCDVRATTRIVVNITPTSDFAIADAVICQDDDTNITYLGNITGGGAFDWSGTLDAPLNGDGPFTYMWNSPGNKTITLSVTKDGCTSTPTTKSIKVDPRIDPIEINCTDQQPTEITFDWSTVANIKDYTLKINGTTVLPNTNVSTYNLNNLTPGSKHFIEVIANSNNSCPGVMASKECIAVNCPPIIITFNVKDTTICLNSAAKPFKIIPTITGGLGTPGELKWTGKGVDADGNFDPVVAGVSTGPGHLVRLDFSEGDCKQTKTFYVRILAQPVAAFTLPDKICVDDELILTYTGIGGVPINWTAPSGTNITLVSGNDYKTKFNNPGNYKIGLVIGNAICLSEKLEKPVTVEPKLDLVNITCVSTLSSVEFIWNDINCASQYQITLDGADKGAQSQLKYLASGLAEGTKVKIEVLPISECECPGVKSTLECEAKKCPPVVLSISSTTNNFCEGEVTAAFPLKIDIKGSGGTGTGKWSGTGVNASGIFDPKDLKAGVYKVKYEFLEENCPFETTFDIVINQNPTISAVTTSPDCYAYNFGTVITTVIGGDGNYTYKLDGNAATQNDFDKVTPGSHVVIVVDGKGCDASTTFNITSAPSGELEISGTPEILKGQTTGLIGTVKSIPGKLDSIVWTDESGKVLCSGLNCINLNGLKPEVTTTYYARAYYNSGCYISDTFVLIVTPLIEIVLPNIIRPGSGGSNNNFFIQSYANIELVKSMNIFDRWGNLVYTKENFVPGPDTFWDGKLLGKDIVPGVYVYTIDLVKKGGKEEKFNGDITVIK